MSIYMPIRLFSHTAQLFKKIPNCTNCMHYRPVYNTNSICKRIFFKEDMISETIFYPSTLIARSNNYLCGIEGNRFVNKNIAKNRSSHILG